MCAVTSLHETLPHIVSSELFKKFEFKTVDEQQNLFRFLKERNSTLFKSLDPTKRTIFLRQTGDNFRACARLPTEQISFSILNIKTMVNNPYGQFINALWRGSESRNGLEIHIQDVLHELDKIAEEGIQLNVNGDVEHFNVIVFLVTDIGLLEKLLGKCSSTSMFGCFWCDKKKDDWDKPKRPEGKPQEIDDMLIDGNKALAELGKDPNRKCTKFTKFQQSHKGQYVSLFLF